MNTYQRFNRLIVGGCGGIVVATFLLFPANVFLQYVYIVDNVGPAIWWPFFGSWLIIVVWAFIAKCEKAFARQLTVLTSVLLMLILPIDLFISGKDMLADFTYGQQVSLGIDISCFAMGLYLLKVLKKFKTAKAQTFELNINDELVQEGA